MEMSITERLDKQRTLLEWLRYQVTSTERTIRNLEHQEAEEQRRREVARRELSWKVLPARAVQGHPVLHRGNCPDAKNVAGLLSRDEVRIAFEEFPELEMHDTCAPWGSLGIDKPPTR
ncbi:DUF6233 domain-containing protein [Streptomyces tanashiensis]|uniref:DUF6233 domain-containing protein n=1 Tax=Streptomyces tanashiensis TaxID=67367 RepID=UPI0036E6D094